MTSILDFFNKETNQRFVSDFRKGEAYNKNVVYTEVVHNKLYKTVHNGIFQYYKEIDDNGGRANQELFFLDVPKIPHKYLEMLMDWYREVDRKERTEACLLFYWNENDVEIPKELFEAHQDGLIIDGKLIVYCPIQVNSGTLSEYAFKKNVDGVIVNDIPEMIKWLERNTICYMETHSHHTMSASWSSIDNENERGRKARLYSVYGRIKDDKYDYRLRIGILGSFFELELSDVFELPKKAVFELKKITSTSEKVIENGLEFSRDVVTKQSTEETLTGIGLDYDELMKKEFYETKPEGTDTLNFEKTSNTLLYFEEIIEIPFKKDGEGTFPSSWWNMYTRSTYNRTGTKSFSSIASRFDSLDTDEFLDEISDDFELDPMSSKYPYSQKYLVDEVEEIEEEIEEEKETKHSFFSKKKEERKKELIESLDNYPSEMGVSYSFDEDSTYKGTSL